MTKQRDMEKEAEERKNVVMSNGQREPKIRRKKKHK